MRGNIPAEYSLGGLYVPPLLLAATGGLICAIAIAWALNRTGLSCFFWHPPLALAAWWVLASSLIGLLVVEV